MFKFTRLQNILLIVISILLVFTIFTSGKGSTLKSLVYDPIVMLKYSLFEYPIETITNWVDDYNHLWEVKNENDELRKQLALNGQYSAKIEALQKELNEKNELMGFKVNSKYQKVYASIINRNPEIYNNQITINVGSNDGVKLDNAVVSSKGLIGKIFEVYENTSRVRFLTSQDLLSKVSVQIHTSDTESIHGYLEQYDLELGCYIVRLFTNTDDIKVDQSVTTSGVGGVFPSGLFVGKIYQIQELVNENGRILYVNPAADFSSFEYVAVLSEVK